MFIAVRVVHVVCVTSAGSTTALSYGLEASPVQDWHCAVIRFPVWAWFTWPCAVIGFPVLGLIPSLTWYELAITEANTHMISHQPHLLVNTPFTCTPCTTLGQTEPKASFLQHLFFSAPLPCASGFCHGHFY